MKTKILFFAICVALVSCEKDDDTNPNDDNNKETVLSIKTASPTDGATIAANDGFSYELKCLVCEADYDANATYELAVYLSGDGNSSYVDCGSKTITVTADETSTQTINGQLLIAPGHNSPYTVEINLYKYENATGTPFQLTSVTISYK